MEQTVILGSGIAGISAGYHLKQAGTTPVIFERNADWGGLCGNFTIDGFRFDKFVHFTFAPDEYTKNIFENSSPCFAHPSVSYNFYKGFWLKHPAQNNLAPLPIEEKVQIIKGFIERKIIEPKNYEQWLRAAYGDYFAENFPFKYTRKYWGVEPYELETKWVGKRMYSPDIEEILRGSFEIQDKNFYYTNYMKYPKKGGFRSILNNCRQGLDIQFNKEAVKIDTAKKVVKFKDGTETAYNKLISTLPLPEIVKMIDNVPVEVSSAAENLMFTSGYMVSLGFNRPDVAKHLWFYIYDEDILPARVYSPGLKSPDNAPAGKSALQAEIFFSNRVNEDGAKIPPAGAVLKNSVEKLVKIGLFDEKDIIVKDIRFEKYANIIFDDNIYKNRQIVIDYIKSLGIETIGRFGKWDYLWSHQAFATGREVVQNCLKTA